MMILDKKSSLYIPVGDCDGHVFSHFVYKANFGTLPALCFIRGWREKCWILRMDGLAWRRLLKWALGVWMGASLGLLSE